MLFQSYPVVFVFWSAVDNIWLLYYLLFSLLLVLFSFCMSIFDKGVEENPCATFCATFVLVCPCRTRHNIQTLTSQLSSTFMQILFSLV